MNNKKASTIRIVSLVSSLVFALLFLITIYIGGNLFISTNTPNAIADSTGTADGMHDIFHLGSRAILVFALIPLALTIISVVIFVKSEKAYRKARSKILKTAR